MIDIFIIQNLKKEVVVVKTTRIRMRWRPRRRWKHFNLGRYANWATTQKRQTTTTTTIFFPPSNLIFKLKRSIAVQSGSFGQIDQEPLSQVNDVGNRQRPTRFQLSLSQIKEEVERAGSWLPIAKSGRVTSYLFIDPLSLAWTPEDPASFFFSSNYNTSSLCMLGADDQTTESTWHCLCVRLSLSTRAFWQVGREKCRLGRSPVVHTKLIATSESTSDYYSAPDIQSTPAVARFTNRPEGFQTSISRYCV